MKFEDIYQFFEDPPPVYLNKELAVCYVLSVLTRHDSYGTELIHAIERDYPNYRLSDTVLYSALKFLENQAAIMGYWKKVEGRGRPRRMYRLRPDWQMQARELSELWQRYMVGQQKSHNTVQRPQVQHPQVQHTQVQNPQKEQQPIRTTMNNGSTPRSMPAEIKYS